MEWSERMNAAIDYIEENLAGEVDFNEAAKRAYCSTFHFLRMFFVIIGMTPAEYTRRRRLTLAARELTAANTRVVDVALKYGYDSPEAFARAFRNVHGINPLAAREPGVQLVAFPRVSFQIVLKGGSDMDYRIIEKPAFNIAGRIRPFTTVDGENFVKIGNWWMEFLKSTECQQMSDLIGNNPGAVTGGMMLGICLEGGQKQDFSYAIGVELPPGTPPSPFESIEIPAGTWAVFRTTLDDIPKCWKQIYEEWFPSTGHQHTGGPELEVYLPGDMNNPNSGCDIWIPIIKKRK